MASSRFLIALVAATLGLAVAPGIALSAPPANDDYLAGVAINTDGTPLQGHYQDLTRNTDEATVQENPDLFGDVDGAFPEVTLCGDDPTSTFGRTVWWIFFPDVDGQVRLQAAGFDAVIGLVPYDRATDEPFYDEWFCADDPDSVQLETGTFDVEKGRAYTVQIGGFGGYEGTQGAGPDNADSGDLEFFFDFFRDSDSDGTLDANDDCDFNPGPDRFKGCPDADDDGVPEPPDACPGVKGDLANGCKSPPPRPDVDHDNVFDDGPDQCVPEDASPRDANRNGCLDLLQMSPRWIFNPDTYFVRRGGRIIVLGLVIERFGVADVPKGARVVVTCSRRACRRMVKRANSRVVFRQLSGDKLRAGVKVRIRVTAPGYVGAARVYTIKKNDYTRKTRCLMPGSNRLRTSCSPVR